jgi:hypothetical protein
MIPTRRSRSGGLGRRAGERRSSSAKTLELIGFVTGWTSGTPAILVLTATARRSRGARHALYRCAGNGETRNRRLEFTVDGRSGGGCRPRHWVGKFRAAGPPIAAEECQQSPRGVTGRACSHAEQSIYIRWNMWASILFSAHVALDPLSGLGYGSGATISGKPVKRNSLADSVVGCSLRNPF